jgi:N-acetylneuraminic acid mutarotase
MSFLSIAKPGNCRIQLVRSPAQGPAPSAAFAEGRFTSMEATLRRTVYFFWVTTLGDYFNDMHCYDPAKKVWAKVALDGDKLPEITDHTIVSFKKYLLIFGGSNGREKFNSLYKIDTSNLNIKLMEEYGEIPIPRFGHTAVVYKNSLYVFGGWNGYETLDDLYQYSFISNFWYLEKISYGVKPPSRYRHASTTIGESMFIFGGINTRQTKFNDLYEYHFPKREWKMVDTYGSTPSPRTFHS